MTARREDPMDDDARTDDSDDEANGKLCEDCGCRIERAGLVVQDGMRRHWQSHYYHLRCPTGRTS